MNDLTGDFHIVCPNIEWARTLSGVGKFRWTFGIQESGDVKFCKNCPSKLLVSLTTQLEKCTITYSITDCPTSHSGLNRVSRVK